MARGLSRLNRHGLVSRISRRGKDDQKGNRVAASSRLANSWDAGVEQYGPDEDAGLDLGAEWRRPPAGCGAEFLHGLVAGVRDLSDVTRSANSLDTQRLGRWR